MTLLEEENPEPVAVVRTLADFALALTLIGLMLVGTRAPVAQSSAATPTARQPELVVTLTDAGLFLPQTPSHGSVPVDAPTLARQWTPSSGGEPARLVVQFQARTLATDLHRALLELQTAFGTNLTTILTCPASK